VAAVAALHADGCEVLGRDVPTTVVVGLTDVRVLDMDAVTGLIKLRRRLQPHDGGLPLRGGPAHLRAMLTLAGLDGVFPTPTFPHRRRTDHPEHLGAGAEPAPQGPG
jgi:anti-anti-sigma regulatory factor